MFGVVRVSQWTVVSWTTTQVVAAAPVSSSEARFRLIIEVGATLKVSNDNWWFFYDGERAACVRFACCAVRLLQC